MDTTLLDGTKTTPATTRSPCARPGCVALATDGEYCGPDSINPDRVEAVTFRLTHPPLSTLPPLSTTGPHRFVCVGYFITDPFNASDRPVRREIVIRGHHEDNVVDQARDWFDAFAKHIDRDLMNWYVQEVPE